LGSAGRGSNGSPEAGMSSMTEKTSRRRDLDSEERLRLRVRDGADLEVLSTLLQDAIIPGGDMLYDQNGHRFILIANRFCWERPALAGLSGEDGTPVHERSLCGVRIEHVEKVLQQGMPAKRSMALLNLLAITSVVSGDSKSEVSFVFSGGASLRLLVSAIDMVAEDLEPSRPTTQQPHHAAD